MRSGNDLIRRIPRSDRRAIVHLASVVLALGVLGCSASDNPSDGGGGAAGFAGQMMQLGNGPGQTGMVMPAGSGGMLGTGGNAGTGGGIPHLGAGGAAPAFGMGGTLASGGMMGSFGAGGTALGSGGTLGAGGFVMSGGLQGAGGSSGGAAGAGGIGGMSSMDMETGRLVGITAAHNAVRAAVMTQPPLPPLTWNPKIAQYAQMWADSLAQSSCSMPHHRTTQELVSVGYGENLAVFISSNSSTAKQAVDGWSGEVSCWTYGTINGTEKCDTACYQRMMSDGCGHYTQVVWRKSTELGCGVATCQSGFGGKEDIWICNYAPAGNFVGQAPY